MAIIRRMTMARYRPDAFPFCRPWQDCALMRSRAADHGKIPPRCVPEGAPDGKSTGSRQHIACMYSNTANFGKICVPCIRKAPQSAVGEYTARASCRQGAFSPSEALRSCTAHESCHPLMALPLRRTGPEFQTVNRWAQNRRRRPQAGPGLRQRCQKRPSKGRVPLGGTIGTLPSETDRAAAPTRSFAAIR